MLTEEKLKLLDFYNEGLKLYKLRKWQDSIKKFEEALSIDSSDGPSRLYLERARAFMAAPPSDDWDGIFVMTTK